MKHFFTYLLFLLLLSHSEKALTQSNGVYKFLDIPNTSYGASLGSFTPAYSDSTLESASLNSAFIGGHNIGSSIVAYNNYIADIHAGYLAHVFKHKKLGRFMPFAKYVHYGNFVETDEFGQVIRTFTSNDVAVGVSFGRGMWNHFKYGVNFKTIFSNVLYNNSFGISTDYFLNYSKNPEVWGLGLAVKNVGFQLTTYESGQRYGLPINVQLTGSTKLAYAPFRLHGMYQYLNQFDIGQDPYIATTMSSSVFGNTIEADTSTSFGQKFMKHIVAGITFDPAKAFQVNLAYEYRRAAEASASQKGGFSGFSLGFRLRLKRMAVSYALYGNGTGVNANYVTLSFFKRTK